LERKKNNNKNLSIIDFSGLLTATYLAKHASEQPQPLVEIGELPGLVVVPDMLPNPILRDVLNLAKTVRKWGFSQGGR
jgi:hypothetical protein